MEVLWETVSQWRWITVVSASVLALQIAAVYSALHALRHVRTSQAAVAWTIGLLTLPVVALPMYWIFARNRFEGYREAIRDVGRRYRRSVLAAQKELFTPRNARSTRQESVLEYVADVLDTPVSQHDSCQLLIDGPAFFNCLFQTIEQAESYLYLSFYIIRDDDLGNRVAEALIRRSQAGVSVRVLYDEVGSIRLSNAYLARLTEGGVDIHPFNTRQGWLNRFQINFRNHRKLIVADGVTSMIGGLNIGDEYLGEASGNAPWRDSGILVAGPVTRKVQAVFAGDYYWAARSDLPEAKWSHQTNPSDSTPTCAESAEASHGISAVCATGPADQRPRAAMMFAAIASAARHRLWISTPYLVPDESSMVALHLAKARGVDVRILIPNKADQWAVYLAGFHYEQEFCEADIPVYRYKAGFMHQKCVLVDQSAVFLGSTNLDNRSLYLNFELMLVLDTPKLLQQVAEMLERDFAASIHSNALNAPTRWWFERAGTAVARLFSPVL